MMVARMKPNLLASAALVSGGLCAACLGIYAHALIVNPLYNQTLPHVTVGGINISTTSHWGLGGSVLFYNRELPYLRNITYGPVPGEDLQTKGFDGWGIHYSALVSSATGTWWSFMFSLWYPISFLGILPSVYLIRHVRLLDLHCGHASAGHG